jgi:hypothetical protein
LAFAEWHRLNGGTAEWRQGCANEWSGAGSNRRHMDFQSIALPTELPDLFGSTPKDEIQNESQNLSSAEMAGKVQCADFAPNANGFL